MLTYPNSKTISNTDENQYQVHKERPQTLGRVVVISDLSEERDGPTAVALASVRHLRSIGIDVIYFCGDSGKNSELKRLGVQIVASGGQEIGTLSKPKAFARGLFNAKAYTALSELIREFDDGMTVYHLHNWTKILSPSVFLALKSVSSRLFITTHDYFIACPNGGYFDFKEKKVCDRTPLSLSCIGCNCVRGSSAEKSWRIMRHLEKALFTLGMNSTKILAVHDAMVPLIAKCGVNAENIVVHRNPVQPWTTSRVPVENNSDILFVGRLEHDKGPHLLASAARSAGVNVVFVGNGPLKPYLESEFPEFQFLGWQTRDQIASIAFRVRAVVMPTGSRETFGLVAFESLMSGIPVIVSVFSSTADEILEKKIGFSCDPYKHNDLVSLIQNLAFDNDLCRQMSHRAWALRHALAPSATTWGNELVKIYANQLVFEGSP